MESIDSTHAYDQQPLNSLKGRFKFLWISVGARLLFFIVALYMLYDQSALFERVVNGDMGAIRELENLQMKYMPLNSLIFISQVVAVIAVCLWFYRANDNLHRARLRMLKYTPGWAVGWFFIPFVQLVTPFLVAIEIFKGSSALGEPDAAENWKNKKIDLTLTMWYIMFLIYILLILFVSVQTFQLVLELKPQPGDTTFGFIIADQLKVYQYLLTAAGVFEGIFLILWTKKVTMQQETYIHQNH